MRINPRLGDLDWASATVPTRHGELTVRATSEGSVDVEVPRR
ncbi:hypothetical protein [Isoptericola sp. NPDC057191]